MRHKIIYRPWESGDDDAILELLMPVFKQTREDYYRRKFDNSRLEPEAIHLALVNERVIGHVWGEPVSIFIEDKIQKFGMISLACVAPDMRRQRIATCLMHGLHAYFLRKGYRGSILYTDSEIAEQLYQKVGYQEITREIRTQVSPRREASSFKWTEASLEDLDTLHQLTGKWAKQNFPVLWDSQSRSVHQFNMKQYRVLLRDGSLIGYAKWNEPSEHQPQGLIRDPIAPGVAPTTVIESVQSEVSTSRVWQTFKGSRYESSLRSLGCPFEQATHVDMFLAFGEEIDLTRHYRTAY